MFFILVLIFTGIIISVGALILSLNINLFVDKPLVYQYNFLKNDKYFTEKLLNTDFGNYKTGYYAIAGFNGIVPPYSKLYLGEFKLTTGGDLNTTGSVFLKIVFIDKNGNKFKINNQEKLFLNKGFYKVYILNQTSNFGNIGFFVSGNFLKSTYPINYNSGTFVLEFVTRSKFNDTVFIDTYKLPRSIIDFTNIYNISDNNWEKYNIVHFFASGMDQKTFFYFFGIKNLIIPKDVVIGSTLITGCDQQIQGIYWDKINNLFIPIDNDTLLNVKANGYYRNIILSGGWYLNCFGQNTNSIFGNLEVYSGTDLLYALYVGRHYDFTGNNKIDITGDSLQIVNYLVNDYINGFVYDTRFGVGYIGGKFFDKNIFLKLLDYVNSNDISSSISGFFYDRIDFVGSIGGMVIRKLYY